MKDIFCIGDKVKFLNETGEGIITEINSDSITVEIDDWIPKVFSPKELILIRHKSNAEKQKPKAVTQFQKAEKKQKKNTSYLINQHLKREDLKGRKKGNFYAEIDLHLHNLTGNEATMRHDQKLPFQMDYFKRCLNEAMILKIRKIIVIHGIGEGKLKQTIIDFVSGYENISAEDASYKEYGKGATKITIKGLHKK